MDYKKKLKKFKRLSKDDVVDELFKELVKPNHKLDKNDIMSIIKDYVCSFIEDRGCHDQEHVSMQKQFFFYGMVIGLLEFDVFRKLGEKAKVDISQLLFEIVEDFLYYSTVITSESSEEFFRGTDQK